LSCAFALAACDESGSDIINDLIGETTEGGSVDYESGSSGSDCSQFSDQVSATELEEANQCGVQVSSHYNNAALYLEAALQTCRNNDMASANTNNESYLSALKLARQMKAQLCGGSTSNDGGNTSSGSGVGFEDNSDAKYSNLCVQKTDAEFQWVCAANNKISETSCSAASSQHGGRWSFIDQFSSTSACNTYARDYAAQLGYK